MLEEITIKKISRFSTKSSGEAYTRTDRFGNVKPAERVSIYDGERNLSYFDGFGNTKDWKEGDKITMEVEKSGDYWNFKPLSKDDTVKKELGETKSELSEIKEIVTKIYNHLKGNEEDLPF